MKGLPLPKAKANPQRRKESPPKKQNLKSYGLIRKQKIPKHKSAKFLMRMFVTFLLLTEPASRNPKPALKYCNVEKVLSLKGLDGAPA